MEIKKFIKDKTNKYKVLIDEDEYIIYDDVIVKYNLLSKKNIDKKELNEIINYNNELLSYYESIKYINRKLRSELEIREYLKKKNIDNKIIDKTIDLLYKNNFLNNELYLKAYINDKLNLSNDGPVKIKRDLIKLGLPNNDIDEKLNNIDNKIWNERIDNIISKKIKGNNKYSSYILKGKILIFMVNLGYYKEDVLSILNKYDIIDKDIYIKEKDKAYKELSRKYEGYILDQKVKERLYRKGFKGDVYNEE